MITERKYGEGYSRAKLAIIPDYSDIRWAPVASEINGEINAIKFYRPR